MKQITFMLMVAGLIIGCGSPELQKEDALQLLKKEKQFPRVVDYDIYRADPQHATKLLDKGLETDGYVTIQKTQKLMDLGNPIIDFTEKAKGYLLTTPEEDLKHDVQKVKVADEDIVEIRAIERDKNTQTAVVHYTTVYKNLTPFAVLLSKKAEIPKEYSASFILNNRKWVMEKRKR